MNTRICPFCKKLVQFNAVKCPYCTSAISEASSTEVIIGAIGNLLQFACVILFIWMFLAECVF